jgi:glyoxylase-like metal-dependent hydrolase (beta-lactamase superfamily II)
MGFDFGLAPDALEWVVLTIGHISVNKYWGETERVRSPLCTSTLIRTDAGLVLVDPSVYPDRMTALLHDQAGVRPEDVRFVYLTHCHGDHRYGLPAFPHARWLMAQAELDYWRERATPDEQSLIERIEPTGSEPFAGVRTLHAPGHTPGTTALILDWRGKRVAIAGDAVMTEDHFRARDGHSNSTDFGQVRDTIEQLAREMDVIVPGHGNAFAVAWTK